MGKERAGGLGCLRSDPSSAVRLRLLVGRGLEPSGPQSPHLYDGSNHSSHLTGLPHESLSQLTRRVSNMPGPKACALGVLTTVVIIRAVTVMGWQMSK